jgi:hypothetical protein
MRKLIIVGVAVLAMGLWLIPIPAQAQGRGLGRADGGPGMSGSHAPLGGPGGDMGASHGSAHESGSANDGTHAGSKTPNQLLTQNTKLSDNLVKLLPAGVTPQQACQNFKNLGQCVAAIHVAHDLGINFNSLTCDMTLKPVGSGTCSSTPSKAMSLGASINALKPGTDSKAESKKAATQAKQDIQESNS